MIKIQNQNSKTLLSMATSLVAMAMTIIVNFFLSPYIVKTLGEEANGFTQLANNFVNYASLITIALNSMAGRFITMHQCRGENEKANTYYSSAIIANFFIILVLIVPAIFLVFKLEKIINISAVNVLHVKVLFALVFLNFFLAQINSMFSIATYVTNEQYISNLINCIKTVLNALALLFVFALFTPKIFYVSLVAVILSAITVPLFLIVSRKILPDLRLSIKLFSIKAILQLVSSGIWNVITQCGALLMTGVDLLLANLYVGPTAMGVLSVSKTMPNCIAQIGGSVNSSFSPNLTISYATADKQGLLSSLRFAMKCSSILMCLPVMLLCVYGVAFYSLWQPTLNSNTLSLLSFLACLQFIPFAGPQVLYNVYTTTNKLKANSLSVLITGVLNVLVVFILIKHTTLGLVAIAAVSSILAILKNVVLTVPYTAKILNLKWYVFYKDVLISCLCCAITGLICYVFQKIIIPASWIKLIISALLAGVISLVILVFVLFSKEERKRVLKKLKLIKDN